MPHTCNCFWLQAAAQQLQVGVTTLKKICRTAKVTRWPFRKRTSIERLIERTQYFMADDDDLQQKLAELQPLLAERDCLKVALLLFGLALDCVVLWGLSQCSPFLVLSCGKGLKIALGSNLLLFSLAFQQLFWQIGAPVMFVLCYIPI